MRGQRRPAISPPSGVHSKQDLLRTKLDAVRPRTPQTYVPPRPAFDSDPHTEVKAPDPTLLAMARRGQRQGARSLGWFVFGVLVGALTVWTQTRDVRADVYKVRAWAASSIRAMHPRDEAPPAPPISVPAPAAALGSAPPPEVPTVDVMSLPRSPAHR